MFMLVINVITHVCRSVYKKSVSLSDVNQNQNMWAHSKYKFSRKSVVDGRDLPCGKTDRQTNRQHCGQTDVTGQWEQTFANVYLKAV